MRDLLISLMVFGSLPLTFVSPQVGVLVFGWLSYMNPHRLAWGFAYNFPFALIVGAVTFVAFLVSREPKRLPLNSVTVLLALYAIWISITTVFMNYPQTGFYEWKTAIKIILFTGFLTMMIMGTRERLHALVWVLVLSLAYFGIKGGIFTVLGGGTNRVWGPPGSFIADNNQLAAALVMMLPLMRYLHLSSRSRLVRLGLLAAMPLTLFAIIGSYSRGALLAVSAMVLFLILKSRHRFLLMFPILGGLALAIVLMPPEWIARMATMANYEQDASATSRIEAWLYTIRVATKNPIFGGGFGYQDGWVRVAHSIYFDTLGQHGFIGLTLFLLLGIAALRTGGWIVRHSKGHPDLQWARDLGGMVQVSLVGYAVGGAFLNLNKIDVYYHLLAILALTQEIVRRELAAKASTADARAALAADARLDQGQDQGQPA